MEKKTKVKHAQVGAVQGYPGRKAQGKRTVELSMLRLRHGRDVQEERHRVRGL